MADLRHEIHVLISVSKLDVSLKSFRSELESIPGRKARIEKSLKRIASSEKEAMDHFEAMKKERRSLERSLEDKGELIKKYKTQLMTIKSNREYKAMIKEIEHLEREIDQKEEKLLILMDEIEDQSRENAAFLEKVSGERKELNKEKTELEERERFLKREIEKLEGKKPAFLSELDAAIRKKYKRILDKLHDFAVTNVRDEICQGCFAKIPPQTANEVRRNDRIITCEECGRILVHY